MPWIITVAAAATYLLTRSGAYEFFSFQLGFHARHAASFGGSFFSPRFLFYPHLLRLLTLPARWTDAAPPILLAGQVLSALCGGIAAGLFYRRLCAVVEEWRAALIGAALFASSFAVWHAAVQPLPQTLALALGLSALGVGWPRFRLASTPRLATASLLAALAALIDIAAIFWLAPLALAASFGRSRGGAVKSCLIILAPALAIVVAAQWLAWRHVCSLGLVSSWDHWFSVSKAVAPETEGLARLIDWFRTLKYAFLYRTPWFIGLPVALAFLGLIPGWRRHRRAIAVYGLWAAGGAARALFVDPVETRVWALAMPGVLGLAAIGLDSILMWKNLRRFRNAAVLVSVLTLLMFIGFNRGKLPTFERLWLYNQSKEPAARVADLSGGQHDLFLVPQGTFEFIMRYDYEKISVLTPEALAYSAGVNSMEVSPFAGQYVRRALSAGYAVFVYEGFLDSGSEFYANARLPGDFADRLRENLPGPGARVAGDPGE